MGLAPSEFILALRIMLSPGSSTSLHLVCVMATMQTVLAAADVDYSQYVNVLYV